MHVIVDEHVSKSKQDSTRETSSNIPTNQISESPPIQQPIKHENSFTITHGQIRKLNLKKGSYCQL